MKLENENLLTEKEKAFVKSVSGMMGLPIYRVYRSVDLEKNSFYIAIECGGYWEHIRSTLTLPHGMFDKLIAGRNYTPKELGLED